MNKPHIQPEESALYYAHGKLLISGEYVVLDGAKALAIPTKKGQKFMVTPFSGQQILWKSFDHKGTIWLERVFHFPITHRKSDSNAIKILKELFLSIQKQNPYFLDGKSGYLIETHLEFPRNWGLGSSSTLLFNLAQWAQADPYELLKNTFGGSGYDIACAGSNLPITYQLIDNQRIIDAAPFNPTFSDQLFFVYLNRKQRSQREVKKYLNQNFKEKNTLVHLISEITELMMKVKVIEDFELLMKEHEILLASILQRNPIQTHFKDYFGQIKSLGAWGGDFVLATGNEDTPHYFKEKGFETVITYKDMVL